MVDVLLFSDSADRKHWFRGIGAYRLASEIRNQGYSCQVLDFCGFYNYDNWVKLVDLYVDQNTQIIGISSSWIAMPNLVSGRYTSIVEGKGKETYTIDNIYDQSFSAALTFNKEDKFIKYLKEKSPNVKLIIGGGKAIDYLDREWADHLFLGFSESQLIDYLKNFKEKEYPKIINWDVESSKNWDFSCSGYIKYTETDFIMPNETLPLEIGRGCIFKCKFCSFPLLGKKKGSYIKDPAVLYEEFMENYNKWQVTNYILSDETFNDNMDKLYALRDVIKRLPFKPSFWAFCRLELVGNFPEQVELLKDIGLKEMQYGIESLNDQTSKAIGKGLAGDKKKEILKFAKSVWKDDIKIKANFIIGLPYETVDSLREAAEWVLSDDCTVDYVSMSPYLLYKRNETAEYRWNSVFGLEYEKWGYYYKDSDNDPMHWFKDDNTGIDSYLTAVSLSRDWQNKISKRNDPTEMFYYSNDLWYNLSLDQLLKIKYDKIFQMPAYVNHKDELFKQIDEKYVNQHLNFSKHLF
jgi:radical SAM superfamily enzyme YgiQ (UPF0313 family)